MKSAKDRRNEALALIRAEKERRGCESCHRFFPYYVLDLSHRDPNTKSKHSRSNRNNIYSVTGARRLLTLCDVLCAVCHRIRTSENKDHLHNFVSPPKGRTGKQKPCFYRKLERRRQNLVSAIDKAKTDKPCTDCGDFYPAVAMDFDHLENKEINISKIRSTNVTIGSLNRELAKCEIVCANCHRERTWQRSQEKLSLGNPVFSG
jgi:hypothetical protein